LSWAKWRRRLTYVAMSLLLGWHTVAVLIAPAPDNSEAVQALKEIFDPYISLLRLDSGWGFFAPSIGRHNQFRYIVEDAAGTERTFIPTEEPAASLAHYVMWREFKYMYEGVMQEPEERGDAFGAMLCRRHAAIRPVSVTIVEIQEKDFWREHVLRGKHPMDPEYTEANPLKRVECDVSSGADRGSSAQASRKLP
jgi:hypothetical protein